jgi:hypothetical protein
MGFLGFGAWLELGLDREGLECLAHFLHTRFCV